MEVTNLVFTTRVGESLNLPRIAQTTGDAKYSPRQFRGLILKIQNGTCIVFHNGKVVIVGVKSRKQAEQTMLGLVDTLGRVGETVSAGVLCLKNVVAYHNYGVKVCLPNLYNALRQYYEISFEPEISPALVLKLPYTVLIFHNGKVIFTGLKNFADLDVAYEKVKQLLTNPQ